MKEFDILLSWIDKMPNDSPDAYKLLIAIDGIRARIKNKEETIDKLQEEKKNRIERAESFIRYIWGDEVFPPSDYE